ncbi:MAG TPA: YifB family Mg chelatase-like AAA ATPase [Thermoanaerobaculia bacterium]|nr:YifB family Mg chelatase-like AAA ATPase [Thermoanaerobaculia bacterium]
MAFPSSLHVLAKVLGGTPWGIDARIVDVEVDVRLGMPQTHLVGLGDTAVRESKERVRSAIRNSDIKLDGRAVLIHLAPADLRKEGSHLDLPIALGLLAAYQVLPADCLTGRLLCGELGLDGRLRPVRGALALAALAREQKLAELLLPVDNAPEAAALEGVAIIGVGTLKEAIAHLRGDTPLQPASPRPAPPPAAGLDLTDVRGHATAKRALEVAAAGGHNLLLIGPPGSGKTMLARRLPPLLPPLLREEAIVVTKIQSIGGEALPDGLVQERPFRNPHTDTSTAGLIGGTAAARPGEVTLAHCGVLFLDELPEFRRDSLEALRQPIEDGRVTVVRAGARFTYPARFLLLAAMNPCTCGFLGDPRHECRCSPLEIARYRTRISGPLLDRIDLHIEVPALTLAELHQEGGEPSADVARRVAAAREVQRLRFGRQRTTPLNAAMTEGQLHRHCRLEPAAQALLDDAFQKLGLSIRAVTRVLKVARTIADLGRAERIAALHVAEAIQYRCLDRRVTSTADD